MTLAVFPNAAEFFARADEVDRATPVYIDAHLAGGERGEEAARRAADMGFSSVFLATGATPANYRHLPFLKGVVGKAPPWLY